MHITNQKLSIYIFTVINLLNIFMEHDCQETIIDTLHKEGNSQRVITERCAIKVCFNECYIKAY